jgi:hypothetical protein
MISKRVAMMFSGYRQSDFTDPAGAALSMCAVFEDYSDELINFATDPKTGVQRKHKWPPTIAEVVEFCGERMAYIAKLDRFKNWGNRSQLTGPIGVSGVKPTLEELHAKYGKDWGLGGLDERAGTESKPAPTWDEIIKQYQSDPSAIARLTGALMTRNQK